MTTFPIFPAIEFYTGDYARIRMELWLYDDFIVACPYRDGEPGDAYLVDPQDVGAALAGSLHLGTGLLPQNTLFWQQHGSEQRIAIWIPPKRWRLRVAPADRPNRDIFLPAFAFVGEGRAYGLWALRDGHTFPDDLSARLYRAPVPNMGRGVCRGSVDFPEAGPDTIGLAADLFFGSNFNEHLSDGKSIKYPNSILGMWDELHESGEEYPQLDLIDAGLSLRDLIVDGGEL
jgi:hypothetical protein